MIRFDVVKKLSLIPLCCIALTACDVVKLDDQGKPIIPMTAEQLASYENMTPADLADLFWGKVLIEAQQEALEQNAIKTTGDKSVYMRLSGLISDIDLSKKSATLELTIPQSSVVVQIGPIIRGNSIRDAASFINFDEFKNQVQFARLSKELNRKAMENFNRPDESWRGSQLDMLAAVTIKNNQIVEAIPLELSKR